MALVINMAPLVAFLSFFVLSGSLPWGRWALCTLNGSYHADARLGTLGLGFRVYTLHAFFSLGVLEKARRKRICGRSVWFMVQPQDVEFQFLESGFLSSFPSGTHVRNRFSVQSAVLAFNSLQPWLVWSSHMSCTGAHACLFAHTCLHRSIVAWDTKRIGS